MQNDTSRRGKRANKICSAPLTIPKSLQRNAALQLAAEQQQLLVLQEGLRAEGQQGWALLWGFSYLWALPPWAPSITSLTFPHQTNPPSPWTQPHGSISASPGAPRACRGCCRAGRGWRGLSPDPGCPLRQLLQGWELSPCRLCIVCNCHWLFLSLFSHFLKSLT